MYINNCFTDNYVAVSFRGHQQWSGMTIHESALNEIKYINILIKTNGYERSVQRWAHRRKITEVFSRDSLLDLQRRYSVRIIKYTYLCMLYIMVCSI